MKLVTLADVRELIERHLPAHCRDKAIFGGKVQSLVSAARRPQSRLPGDRHEGVA